MVKRLTGQAKPPQSLLEAIQAADLHANTPSWGTALHWAAANLHANGVRWLVARGASVDVRESGPEGRTALMRAAWRVGEGKLQTLDALLSLGADKRAKSTAGFSIHAARFKAKTLPVDVARRSKHEAAAALLA